MAGYLTVIGIVWFALSLPDGKKQHQLYSYRSYARKFVNELATPKDLDELEQRIQARRAELNN